MIYTVTFNPAIDYVMFLDGIKTGCVNRSSSENIFFGGKGINVSMVLRELGVESTALGFTAGFTGKAIEDAVRENGIASDFVRLKSGCSRINVKIKSGEETEINSQGPAIDDEALAELFAKTDKPADGDTIILAGSIPSSLPSDIYERICARLDGRGVRVMVDASGELLRNVLRYHPFLVKPNNFELGELFGAEIDTAESAAEYAAKLQEMGAVNVLVSMAEKGAVLLDGEGKVHTCGVCSGTVKNSVGAGDSMLAGFVAGLENGYDSALRLGTAAGGATTFSEGLASGDFIRELYEKL